MTNFNERTYFFIKNIPLTLYSRKGWCFLCVRGELETGTDCYTLTQSSSDHSSTSSSFCLGCSTVGHWGPKPSVCKLFSRWHLVSIWLQLQLELTASNFFKPSVAPVYIIDWHRPASCGHTHLHRIQPHPQVMVIFRYLRPDAPVSLLHWCISWLTARSRVNMLHFYPIFFSCVLVIFFVVSFSFFKYRFIELVSNSSFTNIN